VLTVTSVPLTVNKVTVCAITPMDGAAPRATPSTRRPGGSWLHDLLAPTGERILRRADVTRIFDVG
jgi:hypothetical protein